MFHALVRYAAPVLVFTSEEVWGTRFPDGGSVHLLEWPKVPSQPAHPELDEGSVVASEQGFDKLSLSGKWSELRTLRQTVTEAIEPMRREKVVGSSLEAEIWVARTYNDVDLAELFISAKVHQGDVDKVERTSHHKCGRCWRHLPEVTDDGALCGRCEEVVNA